MRWLGMERARGIGVTAAVAFATGSMAVMQTASIPLLAVLPGAFDAGIADVSWVTTSTLVVGAACNPIVGRMGDMYGKRLLMAGCLALCLAGSLLGAIAGSLGLVIFARALQGVGSGAIPLAYGEVRDELPPAQLSLGVAAVSAAGAGLGAGLGPVLTGAVVAAHGWQAAFWVTAVLCAASLGLVLVLVRGSEARSLARFDLSGALVLAATLVVMLVVITKGSAWGWMSTRTAVAALICVAATLWWIRWERSREAPIVDLALSSRGPVLLAHLGGVMLGFGTFAQYIATFTVVTAPVGTGYGLGRSVAAAGAVQLPGAGVLFVAVLLAGRGAARWGARPMLVLACAFVVAGFSLGAARHGSATELVVAIAVANAGLGIGFCAVPIAIMEAVGHAQTAAVNALNALARVVGSVTSAAVVTAVLASGSAVVGDGVGPRESAVVAAFLLGAVPALGVGLLARRRPTSSLPPNHHEIKMTETPIPGGTP